jgi:hypothetical protein
VQGIARLTLILVLAACGESFSQRAERIQTGVIGLSGREIMRCMGPPEDSEFESDLHGLWVYVRPLERPTGFESETEPGPASGPPGRGFPPRSAGQPNLRDYDRNREQEFLLNPTTARIAPGYCLLKFEVLEGVVRGFEARGRGPSGLNADNRCALVARYCVE